MCPVTGNVAVRRPEREYLGTLSIVAVGIILAGPIPGIRFTPDPISDSGTVKFGLYYLNGCF